MMELLQLLNLY